MEFRGDQQDLWKFAGGGSVVLFEAVCLRLNFLSYPIMACLKAFSQSELMALHFVVSSKLWATKASWDLVGKCWVDSADDDDKCWGDSIFVVILIVDNNFGGPYLIFLASSEKKQKKYF